MTSTIHRGRLADDPAVRTPSRRDSPAPFDDPDEPQEVPVEKEKTRKRKRKGSESWGPGHLPPAVPRDQLQNYLPSSDPDHMEKNAKILQENLKKRHYGDRMHHWQPDLDGFQRIARRSGRKTLADNLDLGPGDDPDYRAKNSAILKDNLRRRGFEGPIREHRPWHDGINTFISPKFAKIQKTLDIPEEKKWAIFEDTLLAHQKKIDFDEKGLAARLGVPEAKWQASNEMGWTSSRGPGDCRTHGLLERT
ncbi:unnamed protein product, partial [Mesorhabditis spiculigera]